METICRVSILALFACTVFITEIKGDKYEPNWKSIDSRPLPTWFDEGKIGIYMIWGVFSVPSFGSEWFWWQWHGGNKDYVEFMKKNYRPDFTYPDFAPQFTTEFFNADAWAELFQASGAKYTVFTTKHHEGFPLWPSNTSFNWNSMAVGPKRDLVGELAAALKKTDVKFGVYHSLYEWFNPLYLQDQANKFQTNKFVLEKALPALYELVNTYKPEVVWSDGEFKTESWYWNATVFLAWLYNESPVKDTVVVNDRWGTDCRCKHGGYFTCHDRFNPKTLQPFKWENAMSVSKGFNYIRDLKIADVKSVNEILTELAETVSCGGNLLMNVGPTKEGTIIPIFEERLRQFGAWLKVNGEAIYSSKPWTAQNDTTTPGVWYTSKAGAVYAIVLQWPSSNTVTLGSYNISTSSTTVSMLGLAGNLKWQKNPSKGIDVQFPLVPLPKLPSQDAWVLKLQN